ncbi:MAG: hypothetical protein ACRDUV_03630, partial [Pseudonocardiaceae bacterium]
LADRIVVMAAGCIVDQLDRDMQVDEHSHRATRELAAAREYFHAPAPHTAAPHTAAPHTAAPHTAARPTGRTT